MTNSNLENLNPIPTADRNSQIQKLSIKAFVNALDEDKFTFRSETIEDAGVDGSLELLINGAYTNLRAQVQLKGTDSDATIKDGIFSFQVSTANLNYLLNGQSAIYILYVVPKKELYYVWARDERTCLDNYKPSWMQQDTVKIHFKNKLTSEAVEQIHERIRKEANLQRKVNDILSSASNTENLTFSISPETLEVTDKKRLKKF